MGGNPSTLLSNITRVLVTFKNEVTVVLYMLLLPYLKNVLIGKTAVAVAPVANLENAIFG
jgi:hypothetical protein